MKLETENGVIEGHRECMDYLEESVEKVFGNEAMLDDTAQQTLLEEVERVFTVEDNEMLSAGISMEEVKKLLWQANVNRLWAIGPMKWFLVFILDVLNKK